jgi:hypothetical protein
MVASDGSAFWIADVEAGSMVDGLEFALLDQDGNLLSTPAKGGLTLSHPLPRSCAKSLC